MHFWQWELELELERKRELSALLDVWAWACANDLICHLSKRQKHHRLRPQPEPLHLYRQEREPVAEDWGLMAQRFEQIEE